MNSYLLQRDVGLRVVLLNCSSDTVTGVGPAAIRQLIREYASVGGSGAARALWCSLLSMMKIWALTYNITSLIKSIMTNVQRSSLNRRHEYTDKCLCI